MSFPCDVAPLIQPMDRGIIECFRRIYRKKLVETLMPLPNCNTKDDVVTNHNDLILWDCCRMIQDAWSNAKNVILIKAWGELLKYESEQDEDDITIMGKSIAECQWCNRAGVKNWFEFDNINKMFMKVYIDEVIRDCKNNTLYQVNIDIVDDEAGPSHS